MLNYFSDRYIKWKNWLAESEQRTALSQAKLMGLHEKLLNLSTNA